MTADTIYGIWRAGIEIIFEQYKLILDEVPEEELDSVWRALDEVLEPGWFIAFEDWLEEQS